MGGICFQADKTGTPYSHFISIQAFSQSAKTYDSRAVKSIFALLLEEVTRPEQAYSEGRNALKK